MGQAVTWFQISGRDGDSLQSFYKSIFAWKGGPDPSGSMMMVKPEKGGIAGGVGKSPTGLASITVYVDSSNLESDLEKIEKAGGHRAMEPMDLPQGMGRIAGFTDPEGNWVGLWQAARAAAKPARKAAKKPAKKRSAKKKKGKKAKKSKRR